MDNLNTLTKYLKDKYKDRVEYGNVGYINLTNEPFKSKQNPGINSDGNFYIHVWGANTGNWNYPSDGIERGQFGSGQASGFNKQEPGVFGIVTMPVSDSELNLLNTPSNTKHNKNLEKKPIPIDSELNTIVNNYLNKIIKLEQAGGNVNLSEQDYYFKYLKYKNKYLMLKK